MSDLGYDPDAVGPEGSPSAVGVRAARAVLAFRHGDGANQLGDMGPEPRGLAAAYADWTGYRPANPLQRLLDPDRWQPLPTPDGLGQRFLAPHWGLVAPFAAAAVLAGFTGSNRFGASATIPAGGSRVEPGVTPVADVTLSWATFTDAADQAGRSRRYGGIHFRDGDLVGRALGGRVGARAWQAASALFAGCHHPGGTAA
jgi:hypothetical protein